LNAAAKQITAARRITFAQAYVQPLTENPGLYRAYPSISGFRSMSPKPTLRTDVLQHAIAGANDSVAHGGATSTGPVLSLNW
jgi:hypothetical protein